MFTLKATHKPVKAYYAALAIFQQHGHTTEGNTRSAFADLLKHCCGHSGFDWHLVEEYQFKGTNKQPLRADGALVDSLTLVHGLWEAKDSADDLEKEIKAKAAKGYPLTNILFQSPDRAILYQDNRITLDADISDPEKLIEVLELFFTHRQPYEVNWEDAVLKFSEKIPDLAAGVSVILDAEYKKNADFREKFLAFAELCRQSINPDLTDAAIQKMLVQHLLTERIFRKVFNNQEFLTRNVIAAEIEKVIHSITAKHFSRDTFLKPLDRFYTAIEKAAESQEGYTEKQHFLNAVYEKFFQSFDKKQADTHGIVYTPQPIVDFMVRSVEEILKSEFGKSLSDEGIHILDPFTGTGNFVTRIIREIKKSRLSQKYSNELHCNEIMLLPYYIASMNIENAYLERAGEYRTFDGICLVDTFELTEPKQFSLGFMSEENTARVKKQKSAPIFVIIANPPYNSGQANENDNNKNREYPELAKRVNRTYARASTATNKNALSNPYVKALRWASDRIGVSGVVAYVTPNRYIHKAAFDGVRKHLLQDFTKLYILDLGGDVRDNPKLSGTTHNVFGIQLGVSISLLVKQPSGESTGELLYARMPEDWKRGQKYMQLENWESYPSIEWSRLEPDERGTWVTETRSTNFYDLLPLAFKKRASVSETSTAVFQLISNGNDSGRDSWVYNFEKDELLKNAEQFSRTYNAEVDRYQQAGRPANVDTFVNSDERAIKWTRNAKRDLRLGKHATFKAENARLALYHPFCVQWLYPGKIYNKEVANFPRIFPTEDCQSENVVISVPGIGNRKGFGCLATRLIPTLDVAFEKIQCLPFYSYREDGANRKENITDWALDQYRTHYKSSALTKWDIFHSTYALLHHPDYRARYAANLKRDLPRIPFPPDIEAFAQAGKRLMELHIDYEKQPEYPLEEIESPKAKWTLRVEKISLNKDKTELRYNEALTLRGIPPQTFEYRLGNRSALEWVIDQYRVTTDKRSGIVNDPNREDDERYILRLIGQVITVSLETVQIVNSLPPLNLGE